MSRPIFLQPRMSEKAYEQSEERGTYVFMVPAQANKLSIASAVSAQYKVGVKSVRIASTASKARRVVKRRGRSVFAGESAGIRKAYVRLNEGESLPIFAAIKEEEAESAKAEAKTSKKKVAKAKDEAQPTTEVKNIAEKSPAKPEQSEKRGRRFGFRSRGNR